MYLFTRGTRVSPGHFREAMDWALRITEKVNQITSLDVRLWTSVMSPRVGSLSWAATVETATDLEDADAKLMADDMFVHLSDEGALYTVGGIEDRLGSIVHTAGTPAPSDSYVTIVSAQLANGSMQRGIATGIEIAEKAFALGGLPTTFGINATGPYGGCAWITQAPSLKALEEAETKVNGDAGFIAFLDSETKDCYQPNAEQTMWRRLT